MVGHRSEWLTGTFYLKHSNDGFGIAIMAVIGLWFKSFFRTRVCFSFTVTGS
jgi:hypothetical protein